MSGGSGLERPAFKEPIGEDEKLRAELHRAAELDPVPASLNAAAKSSFAWYTMDAELAELAELTFDSSLDERALAGVRSSGSRVRLLTFEAPGLTIEVEATEDGQRRMLIGQLVPPQAGRVEVRSAKGSTAVDIDEVGRFTVGGLEPGAISLHFQGAASRLAVTTDWILV